MQCGVFLADAVVTSGAVLEVVAVFFCLDVLPPGSHLGGGDGELVLAFEPAAVVGVVNLQDIPLELIRHVCYHGNFASGLGMVFSQCRRGQDGTKIKKSVGIRPQAVLAPQRFLKPSDFSVQIYAEAESNANELAQFALPRCHRISGEAEYP